LGPGFVALVLALGPIAQFKAISQIERVGAVSAFGSSSDMADTEHINGNAKISCYEAPKFLTLKKLACYKRKET
jgi:hypothetical protein